MIVTGSLNVRRTVRLPTVGFVRRNVYCSRLSVISETADSAVRSFDSLITVDLRKRTRAYDNDNVYCSRRPDTHVFDCCLSWTIDADGEQLTLVLTSY